MSQGETDNLRREKYDEKTQHKSLATMSCHARSYLKQSYFIFSVSTQNLLSFYYIMFHHIMDLFNLIFIKLLKQRLLGQSIH